MPTKIAKIQVRRDTIANWDSQNPLLASGEFGYDTTYNQFKLGDGVTPWTALPYVPVSGVIDGILNRAHNNPFGIGDGTFLIRKDQSVQYPLYTGYGMLLEPTTISPYVSWNNTTNFDVPAHTTYNETTQLHELVGQSKLLYSRLFGGQVGFVFPQGTEGTSILINDVTSPGTTSDAQMSAHQTLLLAGNYELVVDETASSSDYIGKNRNPDGGYVYEKFERAVTSVYNGSEYLITCYPWRLTDASYNATSDVFITDEEIEEIVGLNLEFANGQSF